LKCLWKLRLAFVDIYVNLPVHTSEILSICVGKIGKVRVVIALKNAVTWV
jgi:hypothetical protein